mmetsp:Transcript_10565/g.36868  ORF Transcript_10565/g.36868 Transcript_10565/m.36868 type:complete len:322 (-) Transcript_10565:1311-2276(-)
MRPWRLPPILEQRRSCAPTRRGGSPKRRTRGPWRSAQTTTAAASAFVRPQPRCQRPCRSRRMCWTRAACWRRCTSGTRAASCRTWPTQTPSLPPCSGARRRSSHPLRRRCWTRCSASPLCSPTSATWETASPSCVKGRSSSRLPSASCGTCSACPRPTRRASLRSLAVASTVAPTLPRRRRWRRGWPSCATTRSRRASDSSSGTDGTCRATSSRGSTSALRTRIFVRAPLTRCCRLSRWSGAGPLAGPTRARGRAERPRAPARASCSSPLSLTGRAARTTLRRASATFASRTRSYAHRSRRWRPLTPRWRRSGSWAARTAT